MTTPDLVWNDSVDVLVAGGGGAGLAAALIARRAGARVILVEREPTCGGKTALSMGILTSSETELQRQAGILDRHEDHLRDLQDYFDRTGSHLQEDKAWFLIQESPANFALLQDLGVMFDGPHPEKPHATPRLHNVLPNGGIITETLARACLDEGVLIRCACPARDLILDSTGRCIGVTVDGDQGIERIKANAVVLAAGDCAADFSLIEALTGQKVEGEVFREFASGEVQRMAMRSGARMNPPQKQPQAQLRFVDPPHIEPTADFLSVGPGVVGPSGPANLGDPPASRAAEDLFIVFDSTVAERLAQPSDDVGPGRDGWKRTGKPYIATAPGAGYFYLPDCVDAPWYLECRSVVEVADRIGCGEPALRQSNASLAAQPFFVLGPLRRYIMIDGGGLAIDGEMRVVSTADAPIDGLFAAGACAGWIHYFGGHGHALGWALASGRIAGQNAAASVARAPVEAATAS